MKRIPFVAACAVTLSLLGCSDEGVYGPDDHFGVNESWIINGQLDYDHDAVVALFTDNTGCTGTIIKVTPPYAYVLTAAHCFGSSNVKWVVIGDNYNSPSSKALSVSNFSIHPSYNAQNVVYDFAMIRATGAGPTTPVIPALRLVA